MKRFHCPTCGNEVFFDSVNCVHCHTGLAMRVRSDGPIEVGDVAAAVPCARREVWSCNWPVDVPEHQLCTSCALVDDGGHARDALMAPFQSAQRRALSQLSRLGVTWIAGQANAALRFHYRSSADGADAVIGHASGVITLDLQEADPARREHIRATLGEHYRTPLGHIRHELGHFVWLTMVATAPQRLASFRQCFGDERTDYRTALTNHYARSDDGTWRPDFVSYYASAHPWEDFAESWAQVMHVHDVVETGASWSVVLTPADAADARAWLDTSITATLAANELARAMGVRDLYPFALTPGARAKVEYCWNLIAPLLG